MSRPDYVSNEDIERWSENIDNDPKIPSFLKSESTIREVMYAGLWLAEELDKLGCPRVKISQLQFAGGRLSFGRDPWGACATLLEAYKNGHIEWVDDAT